MSDHKDKSDEERVQALEAELAKMKALWEAAQKEKASLLEEQNRLIDDVFFAAQYGELLDGNYHASIREVCEQTDIDADSLIRKLPPLTRDTATAAGMRHHMENLTDEEVQVCGQAIEMTLKSMWKELRKGSSNA